MVDFSTKPTPTTIKFLCSYGGKIVPRHPDGKLRYHGGETRVLSVHRSISFPELLLKLGELMMCGTTTTSSSSSSTSTSVTVVSLRCQLPTEDLDALVSITCDEDLATLIEEYDRASSPPSQPPPSSSFSSSFKIRAFLSLPKKPIPPPTYPSSPASSSSSSNNHFTTTTTPRYFVAACLRPVPFAKPAGKVLNPNHHPNHHHQYHHPHHHHGYYVHGNASNNVYLIHNGNHWQ